MHKEHKSETWGNVNDNGSTQMSYIISTWASELCDMHKPNSGARGIYARICFAHGSAEHEHTVFGIPTTHPEPNEQHVVVALEHTEVRVFGI